MRVQAYIIHKTIITYGQGESLVAERIEEWETIYLNLLN
jgi:hypothetical protein